MSLTSFVKIPRISNAFDQYATKTRTPDAFRKRPLLVKDARGPQGLAGTSFDYLARFHIARVLRDTNVVVHQRQWVSEYVQERLYPNEKDGLIFGITANEDIHDWLNETHAAAREYIEGGDSLPWLAVLVQYMAYADLFVRTTMGPDMNFDACGRVARELNAMMEHFDPVELFSPRKYVILNPTFVSGEKVGGADADLIVDDRLIEFKTTKQLSLTKRTLLQLAGYAVLHDLGGIELGDQKCTKPLNKTGVYFARHNALIEIPISELFPDDGYEKFKAVFEEEMNIREAKRVCRIKEIDERLAKRKSAAEVHV